MIGRDPDVLRVANCSGFYGDRLSAMREVLGAGHVDVVTGDYLAELTMLILGRDRLKDPATGFAKTFLVQLRDCLGLALDRGVRIVTNAGGVNTPGLVTAIRTLAQAQGRAPRIAYVRGDDLTADAPALGLGQPLGAHAYLGAFGIARALAAGADVVVTGRVTDASLVIGPAIAHFRWGPMDFDPLAGATLAGHVIECGTQATGGNYPFFTEIADPVHPGFPIAEIHREGNCVITKHAGTGGAVTVDTVISQLLYEVGDARYAGPDVTTRLDSVRVEQDGADRVAITGVRGEAPPPDLKVSVTTLGGYRNELTVVMTGLDIDAKAALFRRQFVAALPAEPEELTWRLARTDHPDAGAQQEASALLTVVGRDHDEGTVGRGFANAAVEVALGSYPGFFATTAPTTGSPYGVCAAGFVPQGIPRHEVVHHDGRVERIGEPPAYAKLTACAGEAPPTATAEGPTRRLPLGTIAGARSGDKGGNANVGVWVRDDRAYPWLAHLLTEDAIRTLLPESAELPIRITHLPTIRAVNVEIDELLGKGVAYNARFDPQAKGLAEWLRSRLVDIPEILLPQGNP